MSNHVAIYVRVSTRQQDHKSQLPDLERWATSQDEPVSWYTDTASGKSMNRTAWNKLEQAMWAGKVSSIVVWRLDRLGRTTSGLTTLFDELCRKKINLISLRDGLDLTTPAGRLMANVLASVAQFETEVRGERVRAGQRAAKARGKTWKTGSERGVRKKVTKEQEAVIQSMKANEQPIAVIARTVSLSRPTVYDVLKRAK